jgi:hypothetical protein
MANDEKPRKPTDKSGQTRMSAGPTGASAEFQPLAFPTNKSEIEDLIVRLFIPASARWLPFRVDSYSPNEEKDFDFSLATSAGPKTLDLVEVAFLRESGGSYQAVRSSYKPYEFAQNVLNLILKKSAHYGGRPPNGLHLLLYITHWAFFPDQTTLALLQYWSLKSGHGFEGIYWLTPVLRPRSKAIRDAPRHFRRTTVRLITWTCKFYSTPCFRIEEHSDYFPLRNLQKAYDGTQCVWWLRRDRAHDFFGEPLGLSE